MHCKVYPSQCVHTIRCQVGVLWAVDRLNKLKRGELELGNLQWSPMFLPQLVHILHMLHQTGLDVVGDEALYEKIS